MRYNLNTAMRKSIILAFLLALFLAATWSVFDSRFFMMHDFTHVARIVEMHTALSEGQFPVRWSQNFGYGYGMPLFQFYAPLPYFFGSLVYGLSGSGVLAAKMLIFAATLITIWGSYLLGKAVFGKEHQLASLVLAAGFALAPYRAVNIFVRGALSEAWGMAAFPFILLGTYHFIAKKSIGGAAILYLGLIGLFLSHNLTTVLFMPLSLVFAVVVLFQQYYAKKTTVKELFMRLMQVALVYLLAIGSAGFYLFPAILEKEYTQLSSAILGGYFNFRLHFLYIRQFFQENWQYGGSSWGPDDDISFYLGTPQLIGTFISGLWFAKELYKNRQSLQRFFVKDLGWLYIFSGLFLVGSLLLTTMKTQFLWESIAFLEFIQFPWRWLSIAAFCISILPAWFIYSLRETRPFMAKLCTVLYLSAAIVPAAQTYFQPKAYLEDYSGVYYTDGWSIRTKMSGILPDFIPSGVSKDVLAAPIAEDMIFSCEVVKSCAFSHEVLLNRAHEKLVAIDIEQEQEVELGIAYYPGWQASIAGENIAVAQSEEGLLSVVLPQGEHLLTIRLEKTPVRFWSDILSAAAVITALTLYIRTTTKKDV